MILSVAEIQHLDFEGLNQLAHMEPDTVAAWPAERWILWLSIPGNRWQSLSEQTVALVSSSTLNELAELDKPACPLAGMRKAQIRAWLIGPGNHSSDLSDAAVQQICLALFCELRTAARQQTGVAVSLRTARRINKNDFVQAGYMGRSLVCALAAC